VALDVALRGETLQRVLGFPHIRVECRGDGADRLGVDGHLGRDPLVSLGLVGLMLRLSPQWLCSRATACHVEPGTRWHALGAIVGCAQLNAGVAALPGRTVAGLDDADAGDGGTQVAPEGLHGARPVAPVVLAPELPDRVQLGYGDFPAGAGGAAVSHERGDRGHQVLQGKDRVARRSRLSEGAPLGEGVEPVKGPREDAGQLGEQLGGQLRVLLAQP